MPQLKNELAAAYERIEQLYTLIEHYKSSETKIIEDYKASLVPVAYVEYVWITDADGLQSPERNLLDYDNGNCEPLYALPKETK